MLISAGEICLIQSSPSTMSKSSESSLSSQGKLNSKPSSLSSLAESSTTSASTSFPSSKWGSLFGKSHQRQSDEAGGGSGVSTTSQSSSSSLQSSPQSVKRRSVSEFEGSTAVGGGSDVDEFEAFFGEIFNYLHNSIIDKIRTSTLWGFCVGRFWSEVAIFSFDRGKEIAEKEKERALKNPGQSQQGSSSGFTWVIITNALAQLSQTEKAYVNLTFLAPKGFLRKDVSIVYSVICHLMDDDLC